MPIPTLRPLTREDLIRFDRRRGLPNSIRVLRRRLGLLRTARVLVSMAWRSRRDPLASLPESDWPDLAETLTRHQLRPVFDLDDALRDVGLDDESRLATLEAVIVETGAIFVANQVPVAKLEEWRAASKEVRLGLLDQVVDRLFNARVVDREVDDEGLSFDVGACRFVELCQAAGRPYLSPLFCESDSRYFDSPDAPLRLERTQTIGRGGSRCDFRFYYRDGR